MFHVIVLIYHIQCQNKSTPSWKSFDVVKNLFNGTHSDNILSRQNISTCVQRFYMHKMFCLVGLRFLFEVFKSSESNKNENILRYC